jgi:nucleotide-binding universal stress UspA family protein
MPNADTPSGYRIVVGVDGSESSLRALEWAIRQAELTDASVSVVAAWHLPATWGWGVPVPPVDMPEQDMEEVVERALEPVRAQHPDVPIESRVIDGHPAPVLVKASREADLLVVGSRGHGEFAGMLLGSVSEHCVSNAHCPVLVFRDGDS